MTFANLLEIYNHLHAEADLAELDLNRARKDVKATEKAMYMAEGKADYETAMKAADEAKSRAQDLRSRFDKLRGMLWSIEAAELR